MGITNRLMILATLASLVLLLSCSTPQEPGIIQGHVTIGPIQPVVRPGQEVEVEIKGALMDGTQFNGMAIIKCIQNQ